MRRKSGLAGDDRIDHLVLLYEELQWLLENGRYSRDQVLGIVRCYLEDWPG